MAHLGYRDRIPTAPAETQVARMRGLRGKNVLVTGGSSGIGQAIAIRFAEEGANVAINYRSGAAEAERTHEIIHANLDRMMQHGGKHILVQADVSQEDAIVGMFETTRTELGNLDILINNAGFQISGASHEIPIESFDRVIATNLRGAYICAREAVKQFLAAEKPGVIINISSVHQIIPKPNYIGYSASKGGMQNLTRTFA